METTETFEQAFPSPGLLLTVQAQSFLQQAGKWAVFLGIMGFIGSAFVLIIALFAGTIVTILTQAFPNAQGLGGMSISLTIIYLCIALISFFFALYLYQFGTGIKKGILLANPGLITVASEKLKSFLKLWGITTIVVMAVDVLMIIVFIIIGIGAASMMHR
jgi:hypothetical protein